MKHKYLFFIGITSIAVLLSGVCKTSATQADVRVVKNEYTIIQAAAKGTEIPLDKEHFPGEEFRKYICEKYDVNKDGILSQNESSTAKSLELIYQNKGPLPQENVADSLDITGIKYLTNLVEVNLEGWNDLSGEEELEELSLLKRLILNCGGWEGIATPHMKSLVKLDVSRDSSGKLDVRNLPKLKKLYIRGYSVVRKIPKNLVSRTTLDVSKNTDLEILECDGLGLKKLDVSKNLKLRKLSCQDNQLKSLNISKNKQLVRLNCDNNYLTACNVKNQKKLQYLSASDNLLTKLNVKQNKKLRTLLITNNKLSKLLLQNNTKLSKLNVNNNKIKTISVTSNVNLKDFNCGANKLTHLDLGALKKLESLSCSNNKLTELSVEKNLKLKELYCSKNKITKLNVRKNKKLGNLAMDSNNMKMLALNGATLKAANNSTYYSMEYFVGNQVHTLDIRGVMQIGERKRNSIKYCVKNLKSSPKTSVKKLILSKKLSKADKRYIRKLGKKFGLTLQYVS